MEDEAAGGRIGTGSGRGEDVLPGEARRRAGEFQAQGVREVDLAPAGGPLGAIALGDETELAAEGVARAGRQERGAVVATPDHDLTAVQVDVLHADGKGLHEAEAAAVQQLGDQAKRPVEAFEEGSDVAAAKDGGEMLGTLGALEAVEVRHRDVEDAAVEEEEGAECLVLGRG